MWFKLKKIIFFFSRNIFLHKNELVLGDLGIAREVLTSYVASSAYRGTVNYLAPEVISRTVRLDSKIDIWSFGCTLYEMITLRKLFDGQDESEIEKKIANFEDNQLDLENVDQQFHEILKRYQFT
jgi:serine/threonine protein kinase